MLGHYAAQQSGTADNRIPDGLFVFVSLGMPKAALARIVQQAERAGATLVLRGLVDKSLTATAMAVKDVIGERKVSWMIDPRLFKLYGINAVPVTVMVEPGASMQSCQDQRCNGQANFANRVRTFGAAVPASAMQHITLAWRSAPGSLLGRSEK